LPVRYRAAGLSPSTAWSCGAIAAILANPRYTGRQVWNRQRKDEVLIEVHDVALGHTTKMRWNDQDRWIWSDQPAHEAIIDTATFEQAQARRAVRNASAQRGPRRTPRPYSLRGILYCGICGRRMQGSWNNDAPYYRCVFLREYAAKNKIDHPRAVYRAQHHTPHDQARQEIAECDAKIRQHRAALEAGADPVLVTAWLAEVQAQRTLADARLRDNPQPRRMTPEEIISMVNALHDIMNVLGQADPADKTEIYAQLGRPDPDLPATRTESHRKSTTAGFDVRKNVSEGRLEPLANVLGSPDGRWLTL
jgi:site-specific DNA recombinase